MDVGRVLFIILSFEAVKCRDFLIFSMGLLCMAPPPLAMIAARGLVSYPNFFSVCNLVGRIFVCLL